MSGTSKHFKSATSVFRPLFYFLSSIGRAADLWPSMTSYPAVSIAAVPPDDHVERTMELYQISEMQHRELLPMLFVPHTITESGASWSLWKGRTKKKGNKENEEFSSVFTMGTNANMQNEPKQWNSSVVRQLVGDVGAAVASATLVAPAVTIIDRYGLSVLFCFSVYIYNM